MTTEIQQQLKDLVIEIDTTNYYVSLFDLCLKLKGMTRDGILKDEYDDQKIIALANDMWMALPDSPVIRRPAFFSLCNIAERMFDNDTDEEDGE